MAEQKETILFDLQVKEDTKSVDNMTVSIGSLTEANKKLREERKKLNLDTAEGQKRVQEINKQLDANNAKIKENSSALEKQRLNVGNYTGALDRLVPGLGATVTGFQGMTKAALAFIATPIGAVIGALGLAIGALTAYFKGSEEGQNNFNKVVRVGTVVLGNLLDVVRDFGGALFKVFTGDFKGAVDDLKAGFEGIKNIVSDTANELEEGIAIENLKAQTDVLERQLIVLKATNEARIAELKLKAEDKSLSAEKRQEALNEALKLQNELSDAAVTVAKNRLDIKQRENALSDSTKEDLKEEAELQAQLLLVEKDRADKSKEIVTKNQALRQESIALLEKERQAIVDAHNAEILREADAVIRAAVEEERHQRELEQINERIQAYVSEEEALRNRISALDLEADLTDESADANADLAKELKKIAMVRLEERRNTDLAAQAVAQSGAIAQQVAGESKALSSGIALISTYFSAQKAFESQFLPVPDPSSPIRGAIAAAVAVTGGLARVAQINNIGFSRGGFTGDGYGVADSSGFKPAGIVHEDEWVAPKWQIQKNPALFNALERERLKGYANGGFVQFDSRQATRDFRGDLGQAQVVPVLVLEDFEYKATQKNEIISRAQIA